MEPLTTGAVVGISTAVSSLVGMGASLLLREHLARRKREREELDRARAAEHEREHDTLRLLRQVQERLRENEVECQRMMEDRRREMVENQEALRRLRHESERVQEELEDHVQARQRELAGEPARITLDEHVIRMALARAYSHPDNSGKVLDPQLIAVMAAEIRRELEVREADPPLPLTRPPTPRQETQLRRELAEGERNLEV